MIAMKITAYKFLIVGFLGSLLFLNSSKAEPLLRGPVASATGGAGVAAVDSNEAGILNPASIAHLRKYYATTFTDFGDLRGGGYRSTYGLVLADGSQDKILAGGLSYFYRKSTGELVDQDISVSLAEFSSGKMAFGLGGHRYWYRSPSLGSGHQYNLNVGIIWSPMERFGLGLALKDIWPNPDNIPAPLKQVPTYILGIHYLIDEAFRVRSDLTLPDKENPNRRMDLSLGFESFIYEEFALRAGHNWQETVDAGTWTMGFGYIGPKLSLNYAFEHDWRNDLTIHKIDIWLPL